MKSSPTTNSGELRPVRIDRDLVGILLDLVGRGAALDAAEIEIGLVIDAPDLVGDELAVAIRIERRVGIDMQHRREAPVIGPVHMRIDAERAFLETPELPHRHVVADLAVGLDGDLLRQLEQVPDLVDPGTDADHHRLAGDPALIGVERRHRPASSSRTRSSSTSTPDKMRTPSAVALAARPCMLA